MMIGFGAIEFIVTPDTTYIVAGAGEPLRRVFTDGREWPTDLSNFEATYAGYSIGKWIDEDGDGMYDVLEVEKRAGPSKVPARMTRPACRCTSTTNRSSRNAFFATRPTRESCTT